MHTSAIFLGVFYVLYKPKILCYTLLVCPIMSIGGKDR